MASLFEQYEQFASSSGTGNSTVVSSVANPQATKNEVFGIWSSYKYFLFILLSCCFRELSICGQTSKSRYLPRTKLISSENINWSYAMYLLIYHFELYIFLDHRTQSRTCLCQAISCWWLWKTEHYLRLIWWILIKRQVCLFFDCLVVLYFIIYNVIFR